MNTESGQEVARPGEKVTGEGSRCKVRASSVRVDGEMLMLPVEHFRPGERLPLGASDF